ncbi:TraB/GumN family protein [Flavobacterium gyeonganense]|uniref:TraB/GumN family protein n=1 Tax=Flavobacterium gyeonganense TaxID=1310418 RepID=A0ABV5HCB7_9FLAO|nr:TraB/GumN family protein [Flavobacterium gyeonganense]
MKNLIKSVVAIITLIFSSAVQAQTKAPKLENSLLWEISGNGLSKPSYLYGTVHMICSDDYFLSDKAKKAFDASNKLVLEINLTDPKEVAEMQEVSKKTEPITKKLNAPQLAKLEDILKKSTGLSISQIDNYGLTGAMSLVSMKNYGCKDLKQYEMEFLTRAKQNSMQIGGLETVKSQLLAIDGAYTNDEMIVFLKEFDADVTAKFVKAYKEENVNDLFAILTDKKMASESTNKAILDDRNKNWVKEMPQMMKNESVFFAVDSAHLGGEFGVINLLRKAGYSVKPVMN